MMSKHEIGKKFIYLSWFRETRKSNITYSPGNKGKKNTESKENHSFEIWWSCSGRVLDNILKVPQDGGTDERSFCSVYLNISEIMGSSKTVYVQNEISYNILQKDLNQFL